MGSESNQERILISLIDFMADCGLEGLKDRVKL